MKKLLITLTLLAGVSGYIPAYAEDTTPTPAPTCKVSLDVLHQHVEAAKAQGVSVTLKEYTGKEAVAMAKVFLQEADGYADIDRVILGQIEGDEATVWVGLAIGPCLRASAVVPRELVANIVKEIDGTGI